MKFLYSNLFDFYLEKAIINGTDQQESSVTTPNDILLEEKSPDTIPVENDSPSISANNEHSMFVIQNSSEDTSISTDENLQ
jgi:hypothetical protein